MEELKKEETKTGYTVSFEDYSKLDDDRKSLFCCEFCYYSNLIEGIRTPYIETMTVGEEPKEEPELFDHYSAFDYMLKNFTRNLKEEDIKQMHFILMQNLLRNPEKHAGKYRPYNVQVGGKGCPLYEQVPELMKELESDICKIEPRPDCKDEIWDVHNKFETIHPFVDGNGRTGRLLLNWLSLKHLGMFNVVTLEKREKYYEGIQKYKEEFKKNNPNVRFYKDRKLKPVYDLETMLFLHDFGKKKK